MLKRIRWTMLSAVAVLGFTSTAALLAQQAMPACDGRMSILRLSEIKPGMMDTFLQAATAQQAWYTKNGSADTIHVLRVMNGQTHEWSTTEAMSDHVETGAQPKQDEGYAAFVKLFQQSSTIKTQWLTCEKK